MSPPTQKQQHNRRVAPDTHIPPSSPSEIPTPDVLFTFQPSTLRGIGYSHNVRYLALIPDCSGEGMAIDDGWFEHDIPEELWEKWEHHAVVAEIINNTGPGTAPQYFAVVLDTVAQIAFVMKESEANLFCAIQNCISAQKSLWCKVER